MRVRKRGRETCERCLSQLRTGSSTQTRALTGNPTFQFADWHSSHWATPARTESVLLKKPNKTTMTTTTTKTPWKHEYQNCVLIAALIESPTQPSRWGIPAGFIFLFNVSVRRCHADYFDVFSTLLITCLLGKSITI